MTLFDTIKAIALLIIFFSMTLTVVGFSIQLTMDFFRKPTQRELDKEAYLDGRYSDISGNTK